MSWLSKTLRAIGGDWNPATDPDFGKLRPSAFRPAVQVNNVQQVGRAARSDAIMNAEYGKPRKLVGANLDNLIDVSAQNLETLLKTSKIIEAEIERLEREFNNTQIALKAEHAKHDALMSSRPADTDVDLSSSDLEDALAAISDDDPYLPFADLVRPRPPMAPFLDATTAPPEARLSEIPVEAVNAR